MLLIDLNFDNDVRINTGESNTSQQLRNAIIALVHDVNSAIVSKKTVNANRQCGAVLKHTHIHTTHRFT